MGRTYVRPQRANMYLYIKRNKKEKAIKKMEEVLNEKYKYFSKELKNSTSLELLGKEYGQLIKALQEENYDIIIKELLHLSAVSLFLFEKMTCEEK